MEQLAGAVARAPASWKSKLVADHVTVVVFTIDVVSFVDAATLRMIDRFVTGALTRPVMASNQLRQVNRQWALGWAGGGPGYEQVREGFIAH